MFSKDHFEKLQQHQKSSLDHLKVLQRFSNRTDKTMKLAFVLWFFWMLIWLSLVIGIIWVAIHFISKYW